MVQEPENICSDEVLVKAYLGGETRALDILCQRYFKPIGFYLLKNSWFKDPAYLDDIRQQILLIICKRLKANKFIPRKDGSFKAWVFKICRIEVIKQDQKRQKRPRSISERYPEEPTGIPDDLLMQRPHGYNDYDPRLRYVQSIMNQLTDVEQKLMQLISQDKSYKEINQEPLFQKYSLDYLKRKVYTIRIKVFKLLKEVRDAKPK